MCEQMFKCQYVRFKFGPM